MFEISSLHYFKNPSIHYISREETKRPRRKRARKRRDRPLAPTTLAVIRQFCGSPRSTLFPFFIPLSFLRRADPRSARARDNRRALFASRARARSRGRRDVRPRRRSG